MAEPQSSLLAQRPHRRLGRPLQVPVSVRFTVSAILLSAVAFTGGGCVSSTDIQGLKDQVGDVQRQVLQLQKHGSSKLEVEALQDSVSKEMQELLKSEADMRVEIHELSGQISQLQAKLEDTLYSLNQISQQIVTTNQELKAAASTSNGSVGTSFGSLPSTLPSVRSDSDPQARYQAAYNDYLSGNFDLAIRGFQDYLGGFSGTDLSDNAAYWIGECYFSQGKYTQAIEEFDDVLNRYPRSDKLASALLKKGYAYLEISQRAQGIVQLQHVVREYPGTDAANLAGQRLQSLGVDAH